MTMTLFKNAYLAVQTTILSLFQA